MASRWEGSQLSQHLPFLLSPLDSSAEQLYYNRAPYMLYFYVSRHMRTTISWYVILAIKTNTVMNSLPFSDSHPLAFFLEFVWEMLHVSLPLDLTPHRKPIQ
jgi:hypothetical protein